MRKERRAGEKSKKEGRKVVWDRREHGGELTGWDRSCGACGRSGPKDPNTFLPLSPSQKIWLRPEKLKANWVSGFLMLL